ncbi:hypothetical protein PPACK8108_LOCUS6861 [Phakopsora pachyrhizi]|uniref:Uncharacterized protein n=1 Tax=Phakopsora pachyrhizi TaxID=170000 RepID=A0AAV0ATJ7_PHAPC|nr:hypothetical protein PPACK8108_LOCUS6861 [Phakopsora pachyrhizi]
MSSSLKRLKSQARKVYKQLIFISDNYPNQNYDLKSQIRDCFRKTSDEIYERNNLEVELEKNLSNSISKAIYIRKEIEATIYLTRYRELKRRYGDTRHN